ncbi:hypothetical protein [Corynebacterium freiburgense]|uniref:hypothetical protein n=1 Tax=Corynebacterium freiburgense TaxID=556548 RepID=UPI000410D52F|nr:hypothetical protein [Corynebacterium freiburgense]WJZ03475.1 hypothetical protein CFREI_11030 [Corynebacterium freiburgense]WJZ03573.1 hypothetical protein CFREI_11570 [Corynebacterium freiburgense]WJZ03990.1 hypothetical protein CFREI_13720 [Corynebacterium freiburgense]
MSYAGAPGHVEIEGARQLRASLRRAGIDMKQLKAVNKSAGEIVKTASVAVAPVGSRTKRARVRRLKDTLTVFSTQTGARIRLGAKSVPYAGPIHWGWFARNITPNPFVAEQAQKTEPTWLRLYEEHVKNILNTIEGA